MRLFIISILCIGFHISANAQPYKSKLSLIRQRNFTPPTENYDELIRRINKDRRSLKSTDQSLDSCRRYFLHNFEYEIFPHWVRTTWDYNGYTNRPGKDKLIACGYFVSTPLKHMGFNWNRFKLAQMYSKDIVDTLCADMKKYEFKENLIADLKKKEDHLYIVGLDSHVGMLLKSRGLIWFVHSNYIGLEGPVKEYALQSEAFNSSAYWVGTFTSDENMQKWLDGTLFPTTEQ